MPCSTEKVGLQNHMKILDIKKENLSKAKVKESKFHGSSCVSSWRSNFTAG